MLKKIKESTGIHIPGVPVLEVNTNQRTLAWTFGFINCVAVNRNNLANVIITTVSLKSVKKCQEVTRSVTKCQEASRDYFFCYFDVLQ